MLLTERYGETLKSLQDYDELYSLCENIEVYDGVDYLELESQPLRQTIFAVDEAVDIGNCIKLAIKTGVGHFIQEKREDLIYNLLSSCTLLKKPESFMKNPEPFFVKGFHPKKKLPHVRSTSIEIHSTRQKEFVLKELEGFLLKHPKTRNYVEQAFVVADEMITNALFHGPVDEVGAHLYSSFSRDSEIVINERINFFICHDDHQVLLGCDDPFGSLDFNYALNRLFDLYENGMEINKFTPGAGLGLKMMIDNSWSSYVLVQQGVRTLVCCGIPLGISQRKFRETPKTLHFGLY